MWASSLSPGQMSAATTPSTAYGRRVPPLSCPMKCSFLSSIVLARLSKFFCFLGFSSPRAVKAPPRPKREPQPQTRVAGRNLARNAKNQKTSFFRPSKAKPRLSIMATINGQQKIYARASSTPQKVEKVARKVGGEAANFWCPFLEFWSGGTRSRIVFLKVFAKSSLSLFDDKSRTSFLRLRPQTDFIRFILSKLVLRWGCRRPGRPF